MQDMKNIPMLVMTLALASCTGTPVKQAVAPSKPVTVPVPLPPPAESEPLSTDLQTRKQQFIAETAKKYGIPESEISVTLSKAVYRQSIVNAMARPAESTRTWAQYRPIFLTDGRIRQGRTYYADNRVSIEDVATKSGVPSEMILAIMGVETGWGGNMGSHNVLDALYTLAFHYPIINGKPNPARSAFFTDELGQLFALVREEGFDIHALKGSYAGAMGLGQFMPSSYRRYAVDGDADGRRDLFGSKKDAFASIANYFNGFGWQSGKPVFVRAVAAPGAAPYKPENWEAKFTLAELAARGYAPVRPVQNLPSTLLTLEGAQGTEHWIGFKNFWVITRYNRSPMYAMAVWQLSQEIAQQSYGAPEDSFTSAQAPAK
jgi:membrane-bound lytic murein transglycosylase B